MSAKLQPAYVFDAAATLGIGTPSKEPLPPPEAGFISLVVPDGLSLRSVRESPIGQRLMWPWHGYDRYDWTGEALPGGAYHLRVPVTGSNNKTAAKQAATLQEGEQFAPAALVTAALLCIKLQGGPDPLDGDWTRCAEPTVDGCRVVLSWFGDLLHADDRCVDYRSGLIWASSCRRTSD